MRISERESREISSGRRTLFAVQRRAVHSLAHRPEHKANRILDLNIVFILLLQQALRRAVVRAYTRRLPAAIVARGVRVVQLELVVWVVAGIEKGNTEGAQTTELRVALLHVA